MWHPLLIFLQAKTLLPAYGEADKRVPKVSTDDEADESVLHAIIQMNTSLVFDLPETKGYFHYSPENFTIHYSPENPSFPYKNIFVKNPEGGYSPAQ